MRPIHVIEETTTGFIRHKTKDKKRTLCDRVITGQAWFYDFVGTEPPTICDKGCFLRETATFSAKEVIIIKSTEID